MHNVAHSHPPVNPDTFSPTIPGQRSSRTIARTRLREQRTPLELSELAHILTSVDWHTADAASDLFERRWSISDGGVMESIASRIHDITHILLDDSERIEFLLGGQRITIYPEDDMWAGYTEWLEETSGPEPVESHEL